MRTLILIFLIIIGYFVIGCLSSGVVGVLAIILSALSFILGVATYGNYASEKALNGELLELKKKYYELKYIKDKVEREKK